MYRRIMSGMLAAALLFALVLAGCGESGRDGGSAENQNPSSGNADGESAKKTKITVLLEWTPNTNHTGLYVAQAKGYYAEQGLEVELVQAGEAGTVQPVATNGAQFGISVQEQVTQARVKNIPVVSIAAIIQHNTSGFAAPVEKGIRSPKDFEGKVYGGWGSNEERAVIQSVMEQAGADVNKLEFLNIGTTDYFTAVKRDIDFAWIFYGWTGIEAKLRNMDIDMIYLKDLSEDLDYYTPVIITSEQLINEQPDLVKAFMTATSQGYEFAIANPDEAAQMLIEAEPDLDEELVKESQKWLSEQYQADAPRWGEQKREVWVRYAEWMKNYGLLEGEFNADEAFTNEFLPE